MHAGAPAPVPAADSAFLEVEVEVDVEGEVDVEVELEVELEVEVGTEVEVEVELSAATAAPGCAASAALLAAGAVRPLADWCVSGAVARAWSARAAPLALLPASRVVAVDGDGAPLGPSPTQLVVVLLCSAPLTSRADVRLHPYLRGFEDWSLLRFRCCMSLKYAWVRGRAL